VRSSISKHPLHLNRIKVLISPCRVKLPKSFLAVNLSEAFSFQEQVKEHEKQSTDAEVTEVKHVNQGASSLRAGETTSRQLLGGYGIGVEAEEQDPLVAGEVRNQTTP
jgi:hypothetical protein